MQYRTLGRTGLRISAVGLGAWEIGGAATLTFEGLGTIPHGWGANLLGYNTAVVTPKPDSWSLVFDPNSPYKGKITAYDSPIYIADAALSLSKTQPDLGITNPYALDDTQFQAAVDLLKQQKPILNSYWSDYTKEVAGFSSGASRARRRSI